MSNIGLKIKVKVISKLIYKDWFDGKAKFHKFYTNEDIKRFIEHNKIKVIGTVSI